MSFLPPVVMAIRSDSEQFFVDTDKVMAQLDKMGASTGLAMAAAKSAWETMVVSTTESATKVEANATKTAEGVERVPAATAEAATGVSANMAEIDRAMMLMASATADNTASAAASLEKLAALSEAAAARVATSQKTAATFFGMTSKDIKKVSDSGEKVASGMVLTGAVIGGVGLDMAAKFQKSTQLLLTAGHETQDSIGMVRDGIMDIAKDTGVGMDDLSEGMYTANKAFYTGADGLQVLRAAAEGAVAEGVDMSTMINAVTDIMKDYHLESSDAVSVTNQMVRASGAAKTTMQEFAGSMGALVPLGAETGISFGELGGALATITQHGVSSQQAAQNLAHAISTLQSPSSVASNEMQQLGINVQDVQQNLGKRGLTGTLEMLTQAITDHMPEGGKVIMDAMNQSKTAAADLQTMLSKMPEDLRAASQGFLDGSVDAAKYTKAFKGMGADGDAMGKQFMALAQKANGFNDLLKSGSSDSQTYTAALGKMMGGQDGLKVALMLSGANMADFKRNVQDISGAASENSDHIETNATTQATLAAQLARTKEELAAMFITLGDKLIPAFSQAVDAGMGFIHFLEENQAAAIGLAAILGGVLTVASAAWALGAVKDISEGIKAWKEFKTALEASKAATLLMAGAQGVATAAQWAWNVAMDANPLMLWVIGIGLLVGAIVLAYNNIGWFKDGVDAVFSWLGDRGKEIADWWTNTAAPALSGFWNGVVDGWNQSIGMFSDFFTNTVGMFTDFGNNTSGMVTDWSNNTSGMFTDFTNNTMGMFNDWGARVADGWRGYWKDPIGETENFVTSVNSNLDSFNKDTNGMLADFGNNTKGMFEDWTNNTKKAAADWAVDAATHVAQFGKDAGQSISDFNAQTNGMFNDFVSNTGGMFKDFWTNSTQAVTDFSTTAPGDVANFNSQTNGMFNDFVSNTSGMLTDWGNNSKQAVADFAVGAAKNVTDFNHSTNGMFKDFVGNSVGMVKDWGSNTVGMFRDYYAQTTGKTHEFIGSTVGMFRDFGSNSVGMFRDMFGNIGRFFQELPGNIRSWIGNIDISQAGRNIIDGFLSGLRDSFKGVQDFVGGIGQWIADHKGPESYDKALLVPHGGWIIGGLGKGIRESMPGLQRDLTGVTDLIAAQMSGQSMSFGINGTMSTPSGNGQGSPFSGLPLGSASGGGGSTTTVINNNATVQVQTGANPNTIARELGAQLRAMA